MKTATGIFGFWVVLMLHTAFSDSACDVADSRVRRYVSPKRVLWKSESPDKRFGVRMSGENESVLLEFRHGKTPKDGWGVAPSGCVLENKGEKPGIQLDFVRKLQGGLQIGAGRAACYNKAAQKTGSFALRTMAFDASAELAEVLGDVRRASECRPAAKQRSERLDPACAKPVSSLLAWSGMHEPRSIYTDAIGQNGHNGVSTFYGYYVLSAIFTMAPNAAVSAPLEWPFVEQRSRI